MNESLEESANAQQTRDLLETIAYEPSRVVDSSVWVYRLHRRRINATDVVSTPT